MHRKTKSPKKSHDDNKFRYQNGSIYAVENLEGNNFALYVRFSFLAD